MACRFRVHLELLGSTVWRLSLNGYIAWVFIYIYDTLDDNKAPFSKCPHFGSKEDILIYIGSPNMI